MIGGPGTVLLVDLIEGSFALALASPAPAAIPIHSLEEMQKGVPVVIAAAAEDTRLGDFHARARELGSASLVAWTAGCSAVAVADDGGSAPCARCALLFDRDFVLLAARARSSPRHGIPGYPEEARHRLARLIARALDPGVPAPEPGRALVLEEGSGAPAWEVYSRHPSCTCADGAAPAGALPPLDVEAARRRRFAPVSMMPIRAGSTLVRAFFRRSRSPWPVGRGEIGAATATGPHAPERALAEGIERFCMLHAPADVRAAPAAGLTEPLLPVESIQSLLFRPEERAAPGFRLADFHEDAVHDWSWIQRLRDGGRVLAPTTLVGRPGPDAARLVDATSNGYAAHLDMEQATIRALLEVVERDALLLSWHLGLEIVRLEDVTARDFPGATEVHAFLVTQDVDLPVVLLLALREDGSLRCAGGAATGFDEAWEHACRELRASSATDLRASQPDHGVAPLEDARRMTGPEDHLRHYQDGSRARAAIEWMLARATGRTPPVRARWPRRTAGAGAVVDALARAGLDAWLADRSLPHVFGTGWHVVRALIPGALELSWGQRYRRLASPRVEHHLRAGRALSTLPHPIA